MIKEIELKHKTLINKAMEYMNQIIDYEHNINHMWDVVGYTYELLDLVKVDIDKEVCVIAAYWHDVGRIKCDEGHEKISADMLKNEMEKLNYDQSFIKACYIAVEKHKWNMQPKSYEGLLLKDADKLAWLGEGRWKSCLENNKQLDSIINLLPKLKTDILYFEESKKIYDRDIIKLLTLIYNFNK